MMMKQVTKKFARNLVGAGNAQRLHRRSLGTAVPSPAQLEAVDKKLKENNVDTVIVAYPDIYGRLLGKRYDASDFMNNAIKNGAHSCTYTFSVDMPMNPLPGFEYANWSQGYGDFHLVPDISSLSICGWAEGTAIVMCDAHDNDTHELVPIAPRSILRKQLEKLETLKYNEEQNADKKVANLLGASELEHYLFETSFREAHENGYNDLKPAGYYSEDYHILQGARTEPFHREFRRALRASGIPVENSKGETGIGQHEVNVQYDTILAMADRHIYFKQCAKEIAEAQGKSITFMAKPFGHDAGSSCHVHTSMVNKDGINLFQGEEDLEGIKCSPLFQHFLAGWIQCTPELFAFMAPTVNSYKRFESGSWAPTATAWGRDNRTAGFRVVGSGPSLRIECRLPGADANPYLLFAGAIAAGVHGIENGMTPPPMLKGDGYQAENQAGTTPIPKSLGEAANVFKSSQWVKETFGEQVQQHYAHFYSLEQQAYDAAVTDWERKRYFEQI